MKWLYTVVNNKKPTGLLVSETNSNGLRFPSTLLHTACFLKMRSTARR